MAEGEDGTSEADLCMPPVPCLPISPRSPASHRSSFCHLAYIPYLSCMCSHVHVCCDVWKWKCVSLCLSSLMCHRRDYSEFPFCPYMGSSHVTFTKPLFLNREAFPDCMSPPPPAAHQTSICQRAEEGGRRLLVDQSPGPAPDRRLARHTRSSTWLMTTSWASWPHRQRQKLSKCSRPERRQQFPWKRSQSQGQGLHRPAGREGGLDLPVKETGTQHLPQILGTQAWDPLFAVSSVPEKPIRKIPALLCHPQPATMEGEPQPHLGPHRGPHSWVP